MAMPISHRGSSTSVLHMQQQLSTALLANDDEFGPSGLQSQGESTLLSGQDTPVGVEADGKGRMEKGDLEATAAAAASRAAAVKACTARVVYCAISYALLFTAFNVAQSFVTTLYPNEGLTSLALIYGFYALCSLVATAVGAVLGMKRTIIVGAVFYTLYTVSLNIHATPVPMILISCLVGVGAGFMWIHQSLFLARACALAGSEHVGYLTGAFFGVFNVNSILGNVIALGALGGGLSVDAMIWIMVFLCCISLVMLCFIDTMDAQFPQVAGATPKSLREIAVSVKSTLRVNKVRAFVGLVPYMVAQGSGASFIYGLFPKAVPQLQGPYLIPQLFLCFGISAIIWSMLCGRIFDKFGWKPLVVTNVLVCLGTYLGLATLASTSFPAGGIDGYGPMSAMLVYAFMFALLDNLMNSIINMTIVSAFPDSGPAFAVYRLWYCFGNATASFVSSSVAFSTMVTINIVLMVAAVGTFVYVYGRGPVAVASNSTTAAPQRSLGRLASLRQISLGVLSHQGSQYQMLGKGANEKLESVSDLSQQLEAVVKTRKLDDGDSAGADKDDSEDRDGSNAWLTGAKSDF